MHSTGIWLGAVRAPASLVSMVVSTLIIAGAGISDVLQAQIPGTERTDLLRHDVSVPGREVVQARVDIAPRVLAARHSHPGKSSSTSLRASWSIGSMASPR